MDTATTTHPGATRLGWAIAATLALATIALLLAAWLTAGESTSAEPGPAPAMTSEPDRGSGDPCALRLETHGGLLEGLGPANRCGDPDGTPRIGGRLP